MVVYYITMTGLINSFFINSKRSVTTIHDAFKTDAFKTKNFDSQLLRIDMNHETESWIHKYDTVELPYAATSR